MIFGMHRQSLLLGIEAGTAGHGPALKHSLMLQAQIIVQTPSLMALDAKALALSRCRGLASRPRLGSLIKVAAGLIVL
jgi:hypothetical protein